MFFMLFTQRRKARGRDFAGTGWVHFFAFLLSRGAGKARSTFHSTLPVSLNLTVPGILLSVSWATEALCSMLLMMTLA